MAGATLVQSGIATQSKGSTITVTLGATPTSGNLLVYMFGHAGTTSISSIASNGQAYSEFHSFTFAAGANTCNGYGRIANGSENTSHVVTYSGSVVAVGAVLEFSPNDTWETLGSVLGDIGTRDSTGTPLDTFAVGATAESTLHVAWGIELNRNSTFSSPTNSYTIAQQAQEGSSVSGFASYKTYTAPSTSESTSTTTDSGTDYGTLHLEFLEAAASSLGGAAYHHRNMMG